jgi:exosortase
MAMAPTAQDQLAQFRSPPSWVLLAGVLALALPTTLVLAAGAWTTDAGAHGPIVLATALWLLWRERADMAPVAKPGHPLGIIAILTPSLALYVLGRTLDYDTLETGGLYGVLLAIVYGAVGLRAMTKAWFPLIFLLFVVPPPHLLLDKLTSPLKEFVSYSASGILHGLGMPVSREGVTIYVAQYQLLVEDACSGLNSLIGLTAVSLLYVYLRRRSSPGYAAVLIAFVLPIAVLSNIVRIMMLILLTYFGGDEVAQGFLHMTTGLFLFGLALLLVFALDEGMGWVSARLQRRA